MRNIRKFIKFIIRIARIQLFLSKEKLTNESFLWRLVGFRITGSLTVSYQTPVLTNTIPKEYSELELMDTLKLIKNWHKKW